MKKISIFGSTGSIGCNALDVVAKYTKDIKIQGLCSYQNITLLRKQIRKFSPLYVCVVDDKQAAKLKPYIPKNTKLFSGLKGLAEFCRIKTDVSLMAISGISCLEPLLAHMPYTKRIGLANKESIVTAGPFVFSAAKKCKTEIIPVDSEINALFQLFKAHDFRLDSVWITASGGALRNYTKKNIANINASQVLSHPTWSMGKRITIDSATLVNKAFEVIETHYFFKMPYEKIKVVIHPNSIVHAMVQLSDKSLLAYMYPPDMKIPISYALFYPKAVKTVLGIDFKKSLTLDFEPVNYKKYPLLKLVVDVAKKNDNGLAVLNACDEVAIKWFLAGKIKFSSLYRVLEYFSSKYPSAKIANVKDALYWDSWGRKKAQEYLYSKCN